MAIKISGTTVIDDSRNICNAGTINATGLNASIGGEYICQKACSAFSAGDVAFSICCCAVEAKKDSPTYVSLTQNAKPVQCGAWQIHPIKFNCSESCFASLAWFDNPNCCSPHVWCVMTHCVNDAGIMTTACLCCDCLVSSTKWCAGRDAGRNHPFIMSSCSGTKAYVYFPIVRIDSTEYAVWAAWCYNTSNNQITQICKCCETRSTCRFCGASNVAWSRPFKTPDSCYFMNLYQKGSTVGCRAQGSCLQVSVQVIDDNLCLCNSAVFACSCMKCGKNFTEYYCCSGEMFSDCHNCFRHQLDEGQLLDPEDNNWSCGWPGPVNLFTYGQDKWILSAAPWFCACVGDQPGACLCTYNSSRFHPHGWYWAFKPLGHNCWAASCNRIIPMCDCICCCAMCCEGIPFATKFFNTTNAPLMCMGHRPLGCLIAYGAGGNTGGAILQAYDDGDCMKRVTYFSQESCGCAVHGVFCFCMNGNCLCYLNGISGTPKQTTCQGGRTMSYKCVSGQIPCCCLTANVNFVCVCIGYMGSEPKPCQYRPLNFRGTMRDQFTWAMANCAVCLARGEYLFAGSRSLPIGHTSLYPHPGEDFNYLCGINCARKCMFGTCSDNRGIAYCWCFVSPTCLACATCFCTTNSCYKCMLHATIPCANTNIKVSLEAPIDGVTHNKFGGVIPMRSGKVVVGGGNNAPIATFYNCNHTCYQCPCLVTYACGVQTNNYCKFIGIVQNTVSAGGVAKIAVPGTVDRSPFTNTCIVASINSADKRRITSLCVCNAGRSALACCIFGPCNPADGHACFERYGKGFLMNVQFDQNSSTFVSYIHTVGSCNC